MSNNGDPSNTRDPEKLQIPFGDAQINRKPVPEVYHNATYNPSPTASTKRLSAFEAEPDLEALPAVPPDVPPRNPSRNSVIRPSSGRFYEKSEKSLPLAPTYSTSTLSSIHSLSRSHNGNVDGYSDGHHGGKDSDSPSVPHNVPAPVIFPADVTTAQPVYDYGPKPSPLRSFVTRTKRKYAGLGRKAKIAVWVAPVLLLVLIIGLSAGLASRKSKNGGSGGASNLPLPSNHGGPYSGDLTYYDPALGSCGITSTSADAIVAVSHLLYDAVSTSSNPNLNPLCGKKIRARRNGVSVDVTVVDRCVGCKPQDLDVTESVFKKLANIDQGRVTVEWAWLDDVPGGADADAGGNGGSSSSSASSGSTALSSATATASASTSSVTSAGTTAGAVPTASSSSSTSSSSATLPAPTSTLSPSNPTPAPTTPVSTPEATSSPTPAPTSSGPVTSASPTATSPGALVSLASSAGPMARI